jgi:hypothetical protein
MLIGINLYDGDVASNRRQQAACAALRRLSSVEALNVQFRTGPQTVAAGMETLAVLEQDSLGVCSAQGRRKPLTREIIDACATAAAARGHRYFAYINSDIIVMPAAVETVEREGRATYAMSRQDVDPVDGAPGPVMTAGLDMFAWSVDWWTRNRGRFRSYVVGDACWDNVYTAIMMCHSDGVILNRDPVIQHERHDAVWNLSSPTARHNGFMAALDARYFSLWCTYYKRLEQLRLNNGSAAEELKLREEVFVWRRSPLGAVQQSLRSLKARGRRAWAGG